MKFDVVPMESVNEVRFGMKRKDVRDLLGNAREFIKFEGNTTTTDDFGFCHVFYDREDKCEAIEIFEESEVFINGNLVFPTDFATAKSIVKSLDEDDEGLISFEDSIGIYAPDGKMESILIGKKGYYDEEE